MNDNEVFGWAFISFQKTTENNKVDLNGEFSVKELQDIIKKMESIIKNANKDSIQT